MRKKIVAGFLALTLVAGNMMPMSVSAEEIENTETAAEPVENEEEDFETRSQTEEIEEVQQSETQSIENVEKKENLENEKETEPEIISGSDIVEEQMPEMEEPEAVQANGASIVESGSCGGSATYTLDSNGELRISGSGEIKTEVFQGNSNIKKVILSAQITSIGGWTFYKCSSLNTLTIPSSVRSIGDWAFYGCESLNNLIIPANVTNIGVGAFSYCISLNGITVNQNNSIYDSRQNCNAVIKKSNNELMVGCKNTKIPVSVKSIGDYAFSGCESLNSIVIPNSVTNIGNKVFWGCISLDNVTIPSSVTNIGSGSFAWCKNLSSIIVDTNNTSYDSRENCNAVIKRDNNELVVGCKNTRIPTNVESIGNEAFRGCTGINSITIPSKVRNIGNEVFKNCKSLEVLIFFGSNIETGQGIIDNTDNLKYVYGYSSTNVVEGGNIKTLKEWAGKKYVSLDNGIQLTLNANGGSISSSTKKVYPAYTYGTLPTPIRTGYDFAGWYTSASSGQKINSSDIVQSVTNQTLYAHWKQIKYTVTFNPNGGSVETGSRVVGSGETLSTFPTPTRNGYTFEGWYTQASGGSKVEESMKVTGNVTVYAHWKHIKYTVTFNPNGGSVQTKSKVVGGGETLSTFPTPTRSGYTFEGWYTQASGGSKVSGSLKVTKNMTLYAHWKQIDQTPSKYTVTFHPNGGSIQIKNRVVGSGEILSTLPTPTRSGYTFEGWYTQASGGSKVSGSLKVTKNVTLYAHWKRNNRTPSKYTITFHPNGGSVQNGTQTITSGGSLKSYPTPTRTGYAFDGWYTSASGGKKVIGSIKVTGNRTFYAHWVSGNITAPKTAVKVTSYNSVEVSWKRVKGVKGYIVYCSDRKNGKYKQVRKTTKTKVHFSKLKQGKTYYYKVKAYRTADGQPVYGKYSKVVKRQIKGKPATPKQKIIQVNRMKGTLTISWNKVKNAQKVQILMSTDGGKYKVWRTVSASKGKAEYVYRDKLKKSHIYSFRLRAYYTVDKKNIYSGMSNNWRVKVK